MNTLQTKDRDIVSLAKAVGIILVVFAHAIPTEHMLFDTIYSFHMPLFFIMSGYCFKEIYLGNAKQFVVKKLKGIWLPFILFSLPFLALHNVFCSLNLYDSADIYDMRRFLWDAGRIVTRMSHNEDFLRTFWFLKELFWGNLIFYGLLKLWKGRAIPTTISLLVLSEVAILTHFRIPYFGITFLPIFAAFYIAVGYSWRHGEWQLDRWWKWLIGIFVMAITIVLNYHSFHSFMVNVTQLSLPLSVLPAIAGTMMVFELCRYLQQYLNGWGRSLMLYIGNHSLFIMALHFLAFKIVLLLEIKVYDLPIEKLSELPIIYDNVHMWSIIMCTILGVLLPLGVAWVWQKSIGGIKELRSERVKE